MNSTTAIIVKVIFNGVANDNADIIFTAGGGVNNGAWESCIENNIKAIKRLENE